MAQSLSALFHLPVLMSLPVLYRLTDPYSAKLHTIESEGKFHYQFSFLISFIFGIFVQSNVYFMKCMKIRAQQFYKLKEKKKLTV